MAMSTHLRAKNVSYHPLCPELESYIIAWCFKNPPRGKEFKIELLLGNPFREAKSPFELVEEAE